MKIFIRTFYYLLITIIGLEFFFQILFFFTNHNYLKNKYEFETYINNYKGINIYPESMFKENYKINIASFGASSTAGDGSAISFSSIIKNYFYYTDKNVHLNNYGILGMPFAGYISELIKEEMHKYDIIIIYSGHNEWETDNYNTKFFNNGYPHPNLGEEFKKELIKKKNKVKISSGGNILFNKYTSYSRLLNFLFRSFDKVRWIINVERSKNYLKQLETRDLFKNPPRQFYYDKQDVTDEMIAEWVNRYFFELNSIIDNLRDDQKLIISTVISDIFFPPLYDFYKDYDSKTNTLFKNSYQSLINQQNIDLDLLPNSANKYFLDGYQCFIKNKKDKNICYKSLIKAKDQDNIAFRVQSGINNGIRKISEKNVIVIDPLKSVLDDSNTINEFREYLVDYHHPSPKGHVLIANEIFQEITPYKNIPEIDIMNNCGSYRMTLNEDKIHDILINKDYCKEIAHKTFKMFNNVMRFIPKEIKFFYNFHISRIATELNLTMEELQKEILTKDEYKVYAK